MRALVSLFGKSPFSPLKDHMEKAKACVERLQPLFSAVLAGDQKTGKKLVDEICQLESEADDIKDGVRDHLPKSMFLPIDRRDLLEILVLQDSIADTSQDIAVTLTLRKMSWHADLTKSLEELLTEVTKVCVHAADIIQEFDELVETSFGGKEAEKVLGMIDDLSTDETIADGVGITVARQLFAVETEMSPVDVMMWYRIFRQVGQLADTAEGIGNRLRLLLAK
jgi:predicted phosphate transport protein (TIGR00153 family)